jgi:hypothetical protein
MTDPNSSLEKCKREYAEDAAKIKAEAYADAVAREAKEARDELRDRFAIQIVGSLILRMPLDIDQITPAMCKAVWTIADAIMKERGQ